MNSFVIAISVVIASFLLAGFIVAVGWSKILPQKEDIPLAVEQEAIENDELGLV